MVPLLLAAVCLPPLLGAFQDRGEATAGTARLRACSLVTPDLAMRVSTAAGRTALERATPDEDTEGMAVAKGASVCDSGSLRREHRHERGKHQHPHRHHTALASSASFTSWNQLDGWLRQLERLGGPARAISLDG